MRAERITRMNVPTGIALVHVVCPACATAFALATMPATCPSCGEPGVRSLSKDPREVDYFAATMRPEHDEPGDR